MFTLKNLIFSLLRESVNVNVTFFKTFPTRALSPISIIIYIYFYLYINVHMFTRHAKGLFLLGCDTLPLKKSNGNMMFTCSHFKKINYGF